MLSRNASRSSPDGSDIGIRRSIRCVYPARQNVPECAMSAAHIKCAKRTQFRRNVGSFRRGRGLRKRVVQDRAGRVALPHDELSAPSQNEGLRATCCGSRDRRNDMCRRAQSKGKDRT